MLAAAALAALVAGGARGAAVFPYELSRLPTKERVVALTFDGGWDASGTAQVLATLQRTRVPAAFFVTGRWARSYPRLARAIAARHDVGNHTYGHAHLPRLSSAAVRNEIVAGARSIRARTGRNPWPLFRFPYGDRDPRTVAIVNRLGYESIRWSIDTWVWMGPSAGQSAATVVRRVDRLLAPGAVIMMHIGATRDGSTLDAAALPRVIALVERRGYRFVSLRAFVRRR